MISYEDRIKNIEISIFKKKVIFGKLLKNLDE